MECCNRGVLIRLAKHYSPSNTRCTNHSQRELQSEGLGSHARIDLSHALHGIIKPTQQAQLPLHQSQRLQSLPRHYSKLRTVSVATQQGHWVPRCMTVSNGFSQGNKIEASARVANGVGIGAIKASRRSRCPLMPPLKVHHYRGDHT